MKNISILYVLSALLLLQSCDSWLDVKPYDKISEGELIKTESGFQKHLNGIYIELNSDMLYGASLSVEMVEIMGGAYVMGTDRSVWGNYIDLSGYEYGTTYWRARMSETWNKAYSLILNCNLLLENLEDTSVEFTGDNFKVIKGEALALRAMLHFDMLRLFGPVYSNNLSQPAIPYYKSYTVSPNDLLEASEVAAEIINDLTQARVLLANDPVRTEGVLLDAPSDGSSTFMYYRNLRMNYYAVTALLARASLYFGDESAAYDYAVEVIRASQDGIFPFVDKSIVTGSPDDPDRMFSSEIIFALSHSQRNSLFKDYFDPSRIPNYVFRMDNDLMSNVVFGGGAATGGNQDDYRYRVNWVATGANRYFYKYSDMNDTGNIRNTMIPMIRLGEMYLIAAESCSGNISDGLAYVNRLRSARGVQALQTLDKDILQYEYIRELYGEGQLFFMYKRMFTRILCSPVESRNPKPGDAVFVVPLPDSETEN
ncbi:MAG: RagB/SusD family nutrient uptake outer membrane protein [Bacteroidales bacterium]|nr:RagB/SusD family nutrient uptake outer membrane protein [Bacteroidales bacterium]